MISVGSLENWINLFIFTEVAAKGASDHLSPGAAKSKVELQQLTDLLKEKPADGSIVLWLNETHAQSIELNDGDKIRVKTKGDSPFVGIVKYSIHMFAHRTMLYSLLPNCLIMS